MTWPHDGPPCPGPGPALLARIAQLQCPWASLRIRAQWLFQGYMRRRPSR